VNEIAALLTSFSQLQRIAKNLLGLRDKAKLNEKVIELQSVIITAQSQTMSIQQNSTALEARIRELEAECMRLKDWSAEKQNYSYRAIARGVFAYVQKQVVSNFQQAHKYCCNCFDQGEKSLLQETMRPYESTYRLICPRCHFSVDFVVYLQQNLLNDRKMFSSPLCVLLQHGGSFHFRLKSSCGMAASGCQRFA
jgi:hypothetical protein